METFASLDRSSVERVDFVELDRYRQWSRVAPALKYISRGAGVSYAPLSFGAGATVLGHLAFDRILRFDPVKEEIEVEAGISLGKLFRFLQPRGFFLPVQPGHPQITIGGCIACNAHGKNQYREGLFADHVKELRLFHPRHGEMALSRTQSSGPFELTCGGYGLTGCILSATLSVRRIPASSVAVEYSPIENLAHGASEIRSLAAQTDLLYSWHDLRPGNDYRGNGFIVRGSFAKENARNEPSRDDWQPLPSRRSAIPFGCFVRPMISLLNTAYRAHYLNGENRETLSFFDFSFPISRKVLYYKLYGPAGFIEHQVLIPHENATAYLGRFRQLALERKPRIVLSSMKVFEGTARWLRFAGQGLCFSIDLPRDRDSLEFLSRVDLLDAEFGAKANLAKDPRLTREIVAEQYSEFESFRRALCDFDPGRTFVSDLSRRLQL